MNPAEASTPKPSTTTIPSSDAQELRFGCDAGDLVRALDLVSIVPPEPLTPNGELAYAFAVGAKSCTISSFGKLRFARATFPISDVAGAQEGVFLFPLPHVDALRSVDGVVTLTATTDGSSHWVAYDAASGARSRRGTANPKLVRPLERTIVDATPGFAAPPRVLRELLRMTKSFLAGPHDHQVTEAYRSITIFDGASRNADEGVVYASTGIRAIFVHAPLLREAALAIHGQHLSPILSFLGRASGDVAIARGGTVTIASTGDQALGWTDTISKHERFSLPGRDKDTLAVVTRKEEFLRVLEGIRNETARGEPKVVLHLDPTQLNFATRTARTASIALRVVHGQAESLDVPVSIDQIGEIARDVRGDELELRLFAGGREGSRVTGHLRTVETFELGTSGTVVRDGEDDGPRYPVRVTRLIGTMR